MFLGVFYDKDKCNKLLRKRVPIVDWLPKYKSSYFAQDALAGITVGLTAIPQGIAYAVVAGLPPQVIYINTSQNSPLIFYCSSMVYIRVWWGVSYI